MAYKVIKRSEVETAAGSIKQQAKESVLLSGDWKDKYAVAVVVADHNMGTAEVHEKSVDTWRVLSGSAKFILGGKLKDPTSSKPGEWRSDVIEGGEEIEVSEGDVIDVPAGVPHQLDAANSRIELLIVKINL